MLGQNTYLATVEQIILMLQDVFSSSAIILGYRISMAFTLLVASAAIMMNDK